MSIRNSRLAQVALAATAFVSLGIQGAAAAYPDHAVTIIASSAPGSGGDATARTFLPYVEKCLGQPVIIVNKAGAGGALALAQLVAAKPDGYTIGAANMPNVGAQAIQTGGKLPADQLDYVANVTSSRVTIDVAKDSKINSLKDFIDYANANPVTLGLSSLGGDDHLTQLLLSAKANIKMTMVPFGDGGSSRAALLGGHVTAASMSDSEAASYLDQVKPLAIAGEQRSQFLPDVPTMRELGFDVIGGSNQIFAAPKGTPKEALDKLSACFASTFSDDAFKADAVKRQIPAFYMGPADTEKYVREQTEVLQQLWKTNPWVQ
ncbi:MAG TPA: tripartite tricarboxylate transporter substrate binding protein [Devosiaceae bacterium]|jgi:tripartite-type tricarboxylate transporter receptor subunit TctC